MRDYKIMITEAELMASTAERVHLWLEGRANNAENDDTTGDEELEQSLLSRGDQLIDLGLARFCLYTDTARTLFKRGQAAKPGQKNDALMLRLACLSNRALSKLFIASPPEALVDRHNGGVENWLVTAEDIEITALFDNPDMSDNFLRDFLECKKPWEVMSEKHRLQAIRALTRNPRMQAAYVGWMDGYAEYTHNSVFHAAWQLAEKLPTTREWAMTLRGLFDKLRRESHSKEAPLDVAKRWLPDPSDADAAETESEAIKSGYLNAYQGVRSGLARLAIKGNYKLATDLLSHTDIALRVAAYADMCMTPEQLTIAFARDEKAAVDAALRNLQLWRNPKTREVLHDISWQADGLDGRSNLDYANMFNFFKKENAKKYPDWFKDEEEQEEPIEPSDQPATKTDIERAIEAMASQQYTVPGALEQLKKAIGAVNVRVGWIWWFSIIGVGVSLWHYL